MIESFFTLTVGVFLLGWFVYGKPASCFLERCFVESKLYRFHEFRPCAHLSTEKARLFRHILFRQTRERRLLERVLQDDGRIEHCHLDHFDLNCGVSGRVTLKVPTLFIISNSFETYIYLFISIYLFILILIDRMNLFQ